MDPVGPTTAVARAVEAERVSGLNLADMRGRWEAALAQIDRQSGNVSRVPHLAPSPQAARERRLEGGDSQGGGCGGSGGTSGRERGEAEPHGQRPRRQVPRRAGGLFVDESR